MQFDTEGNVFWNRNKYIRYVFDTAFAPINALTRGLSVKMDEGGWKVDGCEAASSRPLTACFCCADPFAGLEGVDLLAGGANPAESSAPTATSRPPLDIDALYDAGHAMPAPLLPGQQPTGTAAPGIQPMLMGMPVGMQAGMLNQGMAGMPGAVTGGGYQNPAGASGPGAGMMAMPRGLGGAPMAGGSTAGTSMVGIQKKEDPFKDLLG